MVTFHNGNILDSGADYICHQVNCQGAMNSGVAKAIRTKWPEAYNEYRAWYHEWERRADEMGGSYECGAPTGSELMLGNVLIHAVNDHQNVVHMAAQHSYGYDNRRYTSYDAFWSCLGQIKDFVPEGRKIAFPARIGSVRGGANWNVILAMIEEVLGEDYNVEIWDFDKG